MEAFRIIPLACLGEPELTAAYRIWTHWMKNITFHEDFHPTNCPPKSPTPQRAATLGAGVQVYQMYEEADKHGAAMVGGANPVSWSTQTPSLLLNWS
jgi:hypothetical protein